MGSKMENQKKRLDTLFEAEKIWETSMGAWIPGQKTILRGKDLHKDFFNSDWMELYTFGVTGRIYKKNEIEFLNSLWVYTSYPDPRLWNNRISTFAGSLRSTCTLGVSAAIAVSEATIYGRQADVQSFNFLLTTEKKLSTGGSLEEIIRVELERNRKIAGYGRPVASGDERIPCTMQRAQNLGLDNGRYIKLAFEIEKCLQKSRFRFHMNYGGLVSAFLADLGFSLKEFYMWLTPIFVAGMVPCYLDALNKPCGSFFPLRCSRLQYSGHPPREWPS
jgi:citrate synthase